MKQLDDVERGALRVILDNIPYDAARSIPSLAGRRHELGRRFFQRIITDKSNALWHLLPVKRDARLMTRLRRARQYPTRNVGRCPRWWPPCRI